MSESDDGTCTLKHEDSLPADPAVRNDPVFRDMRIIRKLFPAKDPNEIYAYLEANYDKKNRIQLVIEDFMEMLNNGSLPEETLTNSSETNHTNSKSTSQNHQLSVAANVKNNQSEAKTVPDVKNSIQSELEELRQIFPDCDPNYLYVKLEEEGNNIDRMKNLAMKMLDDRSYPKLDLKLSKKDKKRSFNFKFDLKSFLIRFPEPTVTFYNKDRTTTQLYRDHSSVQLMNDFPLLKEKYLKDLLKENNHSYTLCRKVIEKQMTELGGMNKFNTTCIGVEYILFNFGVEYFKFNFGVE